MNLVRIIRNSVKPVRVVNTGGVVYFAKGGAALPELPLVITGNGQTRWNIGHSEPRTVLYFCGERMIAGKDYRIELPFLDWLAPVLIDTSDSLVLTS